MVLAAEGQLRVLVNGPQQCLARHFARRLALKNTNHKFQSITTTNKQRKENNPMKISINATSKIFTLLLAAITLACAMTSARAKDQVPFKGSADGAIVGVAPDPGGLVFTVQAEGNATHLGRFTREETVLFNPATGSLTGDIVFTAADGDQLFVSVDGGFISPTEATGTYTITGGTGRFVNATGSAGFVLLTPDGAHFSVEFEGTLSSVGSNKP